MTEVNETDVDRSVDRSGARTVVRGSSWALLQQVTAVAVNLGLSPYALHGLGVDRYGLYFFAVTAAQFVGTFDGGITTSAQRFFSTYAGARDAVATTRLLTTLVVLTTSLGLILFAVLWFVAPVLTDHLHIPFELRGEGTFLLRSMGIILGVALVRNAVAALLVAHQRFRFTGIAQTLLYAEYAGGVVLTVQHGWGLQGIAWTLLVQQLLVTVIFVPPTMRYLTRRGIGLYGWTELRRFVSYSGKVQVTGLATLFLLEMDTLVIGAVLPIREVTIYALGANFAAQLRSVPTNGLGPAMTVLGQALGGEGRAALLRQFHDFQRRWVQAVSGWCAVGAATAWFAITTWFGHGFGESGVVGVVALLGALFYLTTSLVTVLLGLLDRPGDEARFSVVMVTVNVALTVPLIFTGPIGVAAATSAGQIAAAFWLARRLRRYVPEVAGSLLGVIPVVPCLLAAAVVAALELAIRPVLPIGPGGLLLCAPPAAIGLVVFAVLVLGPTQATALARQGASRVGRRFT